MASHYNRSAEVLPLHRGVKMPPEEAHGGTSPLARRAIDIDAIERRLRDDAPVHLMLDDLDGPLVTFFRRQGGKIVGFIAGTGFGMLATTALALFIGGGR
jgi:hypothetical protein